MAFVKELVNDTENLVKDAIGTTDLVKESISATGLTKESVSDSELLLIENSYYFTEQWGSTDRTFGSLDIWNKNFNNYLVRESNE